MTIEEMQKILRKSWSKETSGNPKRWTKKNPAYWQCCATALIVQDFFGGEIVKGIAQINTFVFKHYWNLLPAGQEIDFTKEQFPANTILLKSEVLKNTKKLRSRLPADIKKRYEILKLAVEEQIRCAV